MPHTLCIPKHTRNNTLQEKVNSSLFFEKIYILLRKSFSGNNLTWHSEHTTYLARPFLIDPVPLLPFSNSLYDSRLKNFFLQMQKKQTRKHRFATRFSSQDNSLNTSLGCHRLILEIILLQLHLIFFSTVYIQLHCPQQLLHGQGHNVCEYMVLKSAAIKVSWH